MVSTGLTMQVASSPSDVVGSEVEGAVGLVGPVLAVGVTVAGVGGGHAATVATREVVLGVAARCGAGRHQGRCLL